MNRQEKAVVKLTKMAEKDQRLKKNKDTGKYEYVREYIAGGYYLNDKTQISNGSWLFISDDDYTNLNGFIKTKGLIDFNNSFLKQVVGNNFDKISIKVLKDEYDNKVVKSRLTDKEYYVINDNYYNKEWVDAFIECFNINNLIIELYNYGLENYILLLRDGMNVGLILPYLFKDIEREDYLED